MKTEQFFTEEIDKKEEDISAKKKQLSVNAPEAPTAYPAVACAGVENNDFDSDDFLLMILMKPMILIVMITYC